MKRLILALFLAMATVTISICPQISYGTVASTNNKIIYTGDNSSTVFPYNFKIFDANDLVVILVTISTGVEDLQTITTDYSVSGVGVQSGGNVTMVVPPTTLEELVIKRVLPLTQQTDLVDNSAFSLEVIESGLDRGVMVDQEQDERLNRVVKASISFVGDLTLPQASAGKAFKWNPTLDGLVNTTFDPDEQADLAASSASAADSSASAAASSAGAASSSASAASASEIAAAASAESINLPDIATSTVADILKVNAGKTAYEFTGILTTTAGAATASKAVILDANKDFDFDTGDIESTDISYSGTLTMEGSAAISANSTTITDVEVAYLDTVSSNIQTQLDGKKLAVDVVGKFASGTYTGTGSSVNVEFGFEPTMVQIFNVTSFLSWWVDDSVDGTTAHWHGPNGAAGAIYTVTFDSLGFNTTGSSSHTNTVVYYYVAIA